MRKSLILTRSLFVALALVIAGLVPVSAPAQTQSGARAPTGQQTTSASPRPDLALNVSDLPPGYEEAPSLELMLDDVPLRDRVLRQSQPGAGPSWLWTMTYSSPNAIDQARVNFLAEDLAMFFTRALSDVAQISNWREQDASGLGTLAKLYTFNYRVTGSEFDGDGALALFGPGNYLSYLAVLNTDGQAVSDLRMLARIVNSRVDSDLTASVGSR